MCPGLDNASGKSVYIFISVYIFTHNQCLPTKGVCVGVCSVRLRVRLHAFERDTCLCVLCVYVCVHVSRARLCLESLEPRRDPFDHQNVKERVQKHPCGRSQPTPSRSSSA